MEPLASYKILKTTDFTRSSQVFNEVLKERGVNGSIRDQKWIILQSLFLIPKNPDIAILHIKTLFNTVNALDWSGADIGMNHLIFAALALLYPDDSNRLKSIAHEHFRRERLAESGKDIDVNDDIDTIISKNYSLLLTPFVLNALWESPEFRTLIVRWLDVYSRNKQRWGYEDINAWTPVGHKLNHIKQLLKGVVVGDSIQIPSYKRRLKATLTKSEWTHALIQYPLTLGINGMWD